MVTRRDWFDPADPANTPPEQRLPPAPADVKTVTGKVAISRDQQ